MAKAKKTWKLLLVSALVSILVIAAFALVLTFVIAPRVGLTNAEIYNALTKLIPILIALLLVEVAIYAFSSEDLDSDKLDKLAPNSYDSGLYTSKVDDPVASEEPKAECFEEKEPETIIKEVIKEVPVEVVKEVVKEVPVEVPVEVIREVPVEVIKEVEKEGAVEEVFYTLKETLDEEIENSKRDGYPLVVLGTKEKSEEEVSSALDSPVFTQDGTVIAILPFTRLKDIEKKKRELKAKAVLVSQKDNSESVLKAVC